ncbi:hypothetical protein BDK51DRAFT_29524, partial [Blyttiomyces helicus]
MPLRGEQPRRRAVETRWWDDEFGEWPVHFSVTRKKSAEVARRWQAGDADRATKETEKPLDPSFLARLSMNGKRNQPFRQGGDLLVESGELEAGMAARVDDELNRGGGRRGGGCPRLWTSPRLNLPGAPSLAPNPLLICFCTMLPNAVILATLATAAVAAPSYGYDSYKPFPTCKKQ